MSAPKEIKAVYDEDLPQLLSDLGLKEDFDAGKLKCAFTGETITMQNFLGMFSDGQEIKFAANNDEARAKLTELENNHG